MGLLELAQAVFLIELLAELSQVGDQQRAEDRGIIGNANRMIQTIV